MKLTRPDLGHILYVARNLREEHRRELDALRWGDLDPDALAVEAVQRWAPSGLSWVAWTDDGLPTAYFGAMEQRPKVWSTFILATDEFPKIVLPLTRFARRVYGDYLRDGRAHRIESVSYGGNTDAHRWIKLMGGKEEARLAHYGKNGEDFVVFRMEAV